MLLIYVTLAPTWIGYIQYMIWQLKGRLGLFSDQHTSWNLFLSLYRILLCGSTHILRYFDLFLWWRHLWRSLFQFLSVQNVKVVLLKIHFWYADLNNHVQKGQRVYYLWATTLFVIFFFLWSYVITSKILVKMECARNKYFYCSVSF